MYDIISVQVLITTMYVLGSDFYFVCVCVGGGGGHAIEESPLSPIVG